jgi:hypothetical protein
MSFNHCIAGAIAFALTIASVPPAVFAAAQDYRFEAAGPPVKSGKPTVVKIRLVHIPDG